MLYYLMYALIFFPSKRLALSTILLSQGKVLFLSQFCLCTLQPVQNITRLVITVCMQYLYLLPLCCSGPTQAIFSQSLPQGNAFHLLSYLLVNSLSLKLFAFFELYQLLIFNYTTHSLSFIQAINFSEVFNHLPSPSLCYTRLFSMRKLLAS